ncbi:aldo/keto reductase [Parasphingopyxis marina]|uniref:Aldo/keto reductase n=1 Tax=Parasphingopyxis marina TaxID=2761622 RepID=A0A842HYH5_9SPHN|nr:aldo/keto reductase [Parasphingopyxis marina]MBC2776544.1 aldo/keto reductase [Parasphingopyxis marina]
MSEARTPELRNLGATGMKTPKLVLGGNVFGWVAKGDIAFSILDAFVGGGGTMIDTADVYSAWIPGHKGGESETVIGEWLARRGKRDDVLIATKVGMLPGEGGEGLKASRIEAAVEASLKRLQTDYIDLYFAHRDDAETPLDETLQAFSKLVAAGKVRHLGASNYDAARLAEALDISAANDIPAYGVLQPEFHMMCRDRFEGPLQQLCIDKNIGVIPYFGLASGFLTGKYRKDGDVEGSNRAHAVPQYMNERGYGVLAAMDEVAAETGASLAQIALAWNAAQPGITAPIASATKREQLEELMGVMALELSAEQLARLDAVSAT